MGLLLIGAAWMLTFLAGVWWARRRTRKLAEDLNRETARLRQAIERNQEEKR